MAWRYRLNRGLLRLQHGLRRFTEREAGGGLGLLAIAALIGAVTAYAVLFFYGGVDLISSIVFGPTRDGGLPRLWTWVYRTAAVTFGLYAVTWLVKWAAPGPRLQPLPAVILAAVKRGGDLPQRGIWGRTLGAMVTLGFGGSTGSEGPVVAAGAAFGSFSGRFLAMSSRQRRVMLACGAAAGISAAFNAPIGGVMFALEEVLGTFSVAAFSPVVVASVMAAVVARARLGDHPAFNVPAEFVLGQPREMALYIGLALLAAVFGVAYTRGIYASEDALNRAPRWLRPAIGGLVVGAIAFAFPQVLGPGRHEIQQVLFGELAGFSLALLAVAKIAATGATLGSGGSGGFFTPALYVGATMGHAYGQLVHRIFPGLATEVNAYALVGMGGVLAAATHAPISAIVIIFEMTGDYGLILPLMLVCVTSYLLGLRLHPESVYTEALNRAGERIAHGVDRSIFERIQVRDCYTPEPVAVREDAAVAEILDKMSHGRLSDLPVVDESNTVRGVIAYQDILQVARDRELQHMLLAVDIAIPDVKPVTLDDDAITAMRRLNHHGLEVLPVVDHRKNGRLVGVVTRSQIWQAYDQELLRSP
jgi:CIC family chloride channel protein